MALGCKAVFVFAPHKNKTVEVKINSKDSSKTKNDSSGGKKIQTNTEIIIEQ